MGAVMTHGNSLLLHLTIIWHISVCPGVAFQGKPALNVLQWYVYIWKFPQAPFSWVEKNPLNCKKVHECVSWMPWLIYDNKTQLGKKN